MNIKINALFKYGYKKLNLASKEFKFLKKIFDATSNGLICDNNFKTIQAYKVTNNNPVKNVEEKSNNLMLFHGTCEKGAIGILKEGFKNSEEGWFGKGVYLTHCSEVALDYCFRADMNSSDRYFFVNEVLESEKLQTFKYNLKDVKDVCTIPYHQFEKHTDKSSPQPTKDDYMAGFEGGRYVKTDEKNMFDEYIAEAKVVIPRYLVVLEGK